MLLPDRAEALRVRETPIGVMRRYSDGVIVHTLVDGALVDTRAAAEVMAATIDLAGGDPVAVVVDMREIGYAHRDARDAFGDDAVDQLEVATALVVARPVPEFLASQFVAGSQPSRPVAIFDDVAEAVAWAASRVAAIGTSGS